MTRFGLAAAALALGLSMAVGSAFTPVTADQAFAQSKMTKKERAAERASKRAATRAKRASCRAEARAQKLGFIARQRFERSCMRKAA